MEKLKKQPQISDFEISWETYFDIMNKKINEIIDHQNILNKKIQEIQENLKKGP